MLRSDIRFDALLIPGAPFRLPTAEEVGNRRSYNPMLVELRAENYAVIDHAIAVFGPGLNLLTGETGAGKSILLDAFALALGGRGDAGLVRHGAEQGQVTAVFDVPKDHPAAKILGDNGLADADPERRRHRDL